jgi:predicted nucleic acid-binding protein
MTHPRVLTTPMNVDDATRRVRTWLHHPNITVLQPGNRFASLFFNALNTLGTAGNMTNAAYLASLAIEHQADIHSNDADFLRFPGLRWSNPLR